MWGKSRVRGLGSNPTSSFFQLSRRHCLLSPFPRVGETSNNKTVHLMCKEGERLAASPNGEQTRSHLIWCHGQGSSQGVLFSKEAASAVTSPSRGQDVCANSSLHGGEAGGESSLGLALGISTSRLTGVRGCQECSSRTPWLSTSHNVGT